MGCCATKQVKKITPPITGQQSRTVRVNATKTTSQNSRNISISKQSQRRNSCLLNEENK